MKAPTTAPGPSLLMMTNWSPTADALVRVAGPDAELLHLACATHQGFAATPLRGLIAESINDDSVCSAKPPRPPKLKPGGVNDG